MPVLRNFPIKVHFLLKVACSTSTVKGRLANGLRYGDAWQTSEML